MDERLYPHLTEDILRAPTAKITGSDGQSHEVQIFSFGEYGTRIGHELIKEIAHGLSEKLKHWQGQFDYLVALMPGGGRWGLIVGLECGVDLTTDWVNRGGPLYETMLDDEFRINVGGPHGRELCFRRVEPGDRVVILDDVIATGKTIEGVIEAFERRGVKVVGGLTIVTKGEGYQQIERRFQVPIKRLVSLDEKGKIVREAV